LTANALSARVPSGFSAQVLQRLNLRERFADDPAGALAELHRSLGPDGGENRLFALAELSFLHAEETGARAHYLAAAAYAYAFLFPGNGGNPPAPLDPRARLAADLYNRGLTEGLASPDGQGVTIAPGRLALPFGELHVTLDPAELVWAGRRLEGFVAAATLEVRGLRNRYRQAGLGAPLAASLGPPVGDVAVPAHSRIPPRLKVPVTAVLRLEGVRLALTDGRLRGSIELFTNDADRTVRVDGREVPLEFESSAALAYTLDQAPIWEAEIQGLLRGDFQIGTGAGLYALSPYRPGRVPVVLVHGTASSPGRWADLVNELDSDPRIGPHCQFWIFSYNTGNPLVYSGGLLRQALEQAVAELDPEAADPALRRMVVIGHSQGGLLTKLTVVDSGTRFWENVSTAPFEALRVSDETREILRRSLFVTPLPFARRVVFVATPHRGSDVAGFVATRLRRLVTWALTLPANLVRLSGEMLTGSEDPLLRRTLQQGLPRSVDNMDPGNPFIRTLSTLPIAPGVAVHSIIAVRGDGLPEAGGDGVVSYRSAHLDGVVSERVVRSGHSVQSHPEAIEEIRRILRLHLDAGEAQ
jgi:hypothetical protein